MRQTEFGINHDLILKAMIGANALGETSIKSS
jgi:hypothetical protein